MKSVGVRNSTFVFTLSCVAVVLRLSCIWFVCLRAYVGVLVCWYVELRECLLCVCGVVVCPVTQG